jgi:hypothetical protein
MSDKIMMIIAVLGGVSESLSLIPAIKANGVIQLIIELCKSLLGKK